MEKIKLPTSRANALRATVESMRAARRHLTAARLPQDFEDDFLDQIENLRGSLRKFLENNVEEVAGKVMNKDVEDDAPSDRPVVDPRTPEEIEADKAAEAAITGTTPERGAAGPPFPITA